MNLFSNLTFRIDHPSVYNFKIARCSLNATYHHVETVVVNNVTAYCAIFIGINSNLTISQYCSKLNNQSLIFCSLLSFTSVFIGLFIVVVAVDV